MNIPLSLLTNVKKEKGTIISDLLSGLKWNLALQFECEKGI